MTHLIKISFATDWFLQLMVRKCQKERRTILILFTWLIAIQQMLLNSICSTLLLYELRILNSKKKKSKRCWDRYSFLGITHIDSLSRTLIDGRRKQERTSFLMNEEDIMLAMFLINGSFQLISHFLNTFEMKWTTIGSTQLSKGYFHSSKI